VEKMMLRISHEPPKPLVPNTGDSKRIKQKTDNKFIHIHFIKNIHSLSTHPIEQFAKIYYIPTKNIKTCTVRLTIDNKQNHNKKQHF